MWRARRRWPPTPATTSWTSAGRSCSGGPTASRRRDPFAARRGSDARAGKYRPDTGHASASFTGTPFGVKGCLRRRTSGLFAIVDGVRRECAGVLQEPRWHAFGRAPEGVAIPWPAGVDSPQAAHQRIMTSRKPQAASRKPQAASRKPQAASRKPQAASRKPQAASRKPQAASRKPQAASRKPQAASRKPQAASRKPQAASRKPQAASRDSGRRLAAMRSRVYLPA